MERKLGEFPKSRFMDSSIPWLSQAAREYRPQEKLPPYTETSFLRARGAISVIDEILASNKKMNILLAGIGLDNDPTLCSCEPFQIAAHLESKKTDYQMTLVDISVDAIDDVSKRSKLYLSYNQYSGKLFNAIELAWNKYLTDIGTKGYQITSPEEGLVFHDYLYNQNSIVNIENYLSRGVCVANIPISFDEKRDNGEVRMICDDIALADISTNAPYDFAELTNVLYMLPSPGQQLSLANISESLAIGGKLLLNDIGGYAGFPVFSRFGGWLTDEMILELGFCVDRVISRRDSHETVVLRKINKLD